MIQNLIENKVEYHIRNKGYAPTHITMSYDTYQEMRAEIDPRLGYYVPTELYAELEPDKVRGLVIGILPNSRIKNYIEVM